LETLIESGLTGSAALTYNIKNINNIPNNKIIISVLLIPRSCFGSNFPERRQKEK
jgi:hypothetical protein